MRNMSNTTSMNNVVYWYKNQVILTYYTDKPAFNYRTLAAQFAVQYQNTINQLLQDYTLEWVGKLPASGQPANMAMSGSSEIEGVYVFPSSTTLQTPSQLPPYNFAALYNIHPRSGHTQQHMASTHSTSGRGGIDMLDHTLTLIDHLHQHEQIDDTPFDAMPHWLWSNTDDVLHGCPTSPPIPVDDMGRSGHHCLSFTDLADPSLEGKTGKGVSVFVLDTLPDTSTIGGAAKVDAGQRNMLLQSMVPTDIQHTTGNQAPAINLNYWDVPDPQKTAKTGKDVYGRLVGFPMPDHGLTIAGIIRDLAPDAYIECIRVLNDYGVGDTNTLYRALAYIEACKGQNLRNTVINLSLVVVPPKSDWGRFGWDKHPQKLDRILRGLGERMLSMAKRGAVFTASTGNDTDPRDYMMNPGEVRFWPRYPAMFAYHEPKIPTMIPVGAINSQGQATSYSNYPGPMGIGTFGGELPEPTPWMPSGMSHTNVTVDRSKLDAICGIYSAPVFPALSKNDHYEIAAPDGDYPEYIAPRSTWAFWVGTSFATPIISALVARILEANEPSQADNADIREKVRAATKDTTTWTGVEDYEDMDGGDMDGPVVMVKQKWEDGPFPGGHCD